MSALSVRSRTVRAALVGAAALSVVGASAAAASAAPASHRAHAATGVRRACAVVLSPGEAACMALIRTDVRQRSAVALGRNAPAGFGYGPSDLVSAYNLPSSTTVQNVAVVDAYNDPHAVSDLATYRSSWGEPACNTVTGAGCLTVTNQNGATSPLPSNAGSTGWATEESLDVDMVSAICPSCHIFLVEANGPSFANLGTGVNSAVSVLGAKFVSNSYGGSLSASDGSFDSLYYNHPGVAVTASAGDSGYGVSYPAASRDVVAVGGTHLVHTGAGTRGWTESVWSGTGSGCANSGETKPTWQKHAGCTHRIDNDVAAVADPGTGVAVYDTYDRGGWLEVGGTSASSPIIASVYALAGTPASGSYPAQYVYTHQTSLYDITVGSNGTCTKAFLCHAEAGYDGPTGNGTPNGTAGFHS